MIFDKNRKMIGMKTLKVKNMSKFSLVISYGPLVMCHLYLIFAGVRSDNLSQKSRVSHLIQVQVRETSRHDGHVMLKSDLLKKYSTDGRFMENSLDLQPLLCVENDQDLCPLFPKRCTLSFRGRYHLALMLKIQILLMSDLQNNR